MQSEQAARVVVRRFVSAKPCLHGAGYFIAECFVPARRKIIESLAGRNETLGDEITRAVKAGLCADKASYYDPSSLL